MPRWNKNYHFLLWICCILLVGVAPVKAVEDLPAVDPRADRVFKAMSDYLKAAGEYVFDAEITYDDFLPAGQKIQYAAAFRAAVRRPDRVWTEYRGDIMSNKTYYNGKEFVLYHPDKNVYATSKAPSKIDELIDEIQEELGFMPPLSDLLYSDLYQALEEQMATGHYAGLHTVDGIPCHHLLYSHDHLDWQVWVEDGLQPLLRKIVITFKDVPQSPQFSATITSWNFVPRLSEHLFTFDPPEGAEMIEFLPSREDGKSR